MKRIALATLLVLLAGCKAPAPANTSRDRTQQSNVPAAPSAPQNFDYYLLNLSWSPEFCYSHPTAAECGRHAGLVLHGLWPQDMNGSYPQDCSNAPGPSNPDQYSDIYPDRNLLEHEWRTHGTCAGLTADDFFETARAAFRSVKVPGTLANLQTQISLPPNQILALVRQSNPNIPADGLALSCGNNYLTAIEVCLDKQLHPIACGPIRSCRAPTVRIPPP